MLGDSGSSTRNHQCLRFVYLERNVFLFEMRSERAEGGVMVVT